MTLPVFITVIADHDKPQPSGCLLDVEYIGQ
ncbi:hemolysin activation protein, partial [Shigella sonnei]|nr:hemolysin activation protein [Shigella sonnei]